MTESTKDSPTRIIRKPEVLERTGLSNVTLWRLERRGDFPRRRQLSANTVGWIEAEVEDWVRSRPPAELKDDGEPEDGPEEPTGRGGPGGTPGLREMTKKWMEERERQEVGQGDQPEDEE